MKVPLNELEKESLEYVISKLDKWDRVFALYTDVPYFLTQKKNVRNDTQIRNIQKNLQDFLLDGEYISETGPQQYTFIKPNGFDLYHAVTINEYEKRETEKEQQRRNQFIADTTREDEQDALRGLQIKLANYQVKNEEWQVLLNPLLKEANTSAIETNKHTRRSNNILIAVFSITAVISAVGTIISYSNYQLDRNKIAKEADYNAMKKK